MALTGGLMIVLPFVTNFALLVTIRFFQVCPKLNSSESVVDVIKLFRRKSRFLQN